MYLYVYVPAGRLAQLPQRAGGGGRGGAGAGARAGAAAVGAGGAGRAARRRHAVGAAQCAQRAVLSSVVW